MEQWEHMARSMDMILMDMILGAMGAKPQPKPAPVEHRVPDGDIELEDGHCTLIADYAVLDYGTPDDQPTVELLSVYADFGGLTQVMVPLNALSAKTRCTLMDLASDQVVAQEIERKYER